MGRLNLLALKEQCYSNFHRRKESCLKISPSASTTKPANTVEHLHNKHLQYEMTSIPENSECPVVIPIFCMYFQRLYSEDS